MIIIKYKGGLGNQMFQYAMNLAIEKKYPEQQVMADISHYLLLNEHNGYELEKVWGIHLSAASKKQLKKVSPYYYPSAVVLKLPEKIRRIIAGNLQYKYKERKLQKSDDIRGCYYKQSSHCSYEEEIWNLAESGDWYLDGLWQNVEYFKEVSKEIRQAFCFNNEAEYTDQDLKWKAQIQATNSISVHIRRGDFQNSKFDICGPEYYRNAMETIENKIRAQGEDLTDKKYFFFTDDVEYTKEAFKDIPEKDKEIIHHETGSSILDMELMSLCRHHIISNSTFAWWAAWLDENPEAVTVAPVLSVRKPDQSYLLSAPDKWILLEV